MRVAPAPPMRHVPMHSAMLLVSTLLALGGCTVPTGPAGDASSAPAAEAEAQEAEAPRPGVLRGLYMYAHTETTPIVNAEGFPSSIQTTTQRFERYDASGWVYRGPPSMDVADMVCEGPRKDARGQDLCFTYSVSGGKLTVGREKPVAIAPAGVDWKIDGELRVPVSPSGKTRLDGTFKRVTCELSTCTTRLLTLQPDGAYRLSSTATSGYTGTHSAASAGKSEGTYSIEGYALTLTDAARGKTATAFFLYQPAKDGRSDDAIVIDDERFFRK